MSAKEIELDLFERTILESVFGKEYQSNYFFKIAEAYKPGVFQSYIDKFESVVKPFMVEDGSVDGARLKRVLEVAYPNIAQIVPGYNFRLSEVLQSVIQLIQGGILQ